MREIKCWCRDQRFHRVVWMLINTSLVTVVVCTKCRFNIGRHSAKVV